MPVTLEHGKDKDRSGTKTTMGDGDESDTSTDAWLSEENIFAYSWKLDEERWISGERAVVRQKTATRIEINCFF